jgi:predicted phage terminase large subunit-like protein
LLTRPETQKRSAIRAHVRTDLWFLLRYVCDLSFMEADERTADWYFARCNEVQDAPNGYLDLWSREHGKSTVITFGKSIQDILRSHGDDPIEWPECTIGIFSHTRPIAKAFLKQIKREFETNAMLIDLFPDIIYENPTKDASAWSLDSGIVLKRRSNPKEATVEAHGLVDGQPTSKHYTHLIYDDIVTLGSVTSPEMIKKTTEALAISYNLGSEQSKIRRFIGTRYHQNDTYKTIIDRGTATPRLYPATDDGTFDGTPVLWSRETFEAKVRDFGPYVAACQLLQNPRADSAQGLKQEWLRYYTPTLHHGHNVYMTVDPAHAKKKDSDYTVISIWGLGADENYYLLDMIRDRLNLKQRTDAVFLMHRKHKPIMIGYERYGLQADVEHMRLEQERVNYRFPIVEVGGTMAKTDRIKRLVPILCEGRCYIPQEIWYKTVEGEDVELVRQFVDDEYLSFPVSTHDDMLDSMSRIFDIATTFPGGWGHKALDYSKQDAVVV